MGFVFKLIFIIAFFYGYVANVLIVIKSAGAPIVEMTTELLIRVTGIFIPFVGAIAGYF